MSNCSCEETEAPIYSMVLEQEAIDLHKLSKLIEHNRNNTGYSLDLSADFISCLFPNEFPFQVDDKHNIKTITMIRNTKFQDIN